ncbi:hypothetical protein BY458DRAFT_490985 [Sporodiniella umbellata]|nr:hypothetical protein BY458DRAFT_490985 [Sporodiniella umbellata]
MSDVDSVNQNQQKALIAIYEDNLSESDTEFGSTLEELSELDELHYSDDSVELSIIIENTEKNPISKKLLQEDEQIDIESLDSGNTIQSPFQKKVQPKAEDDVEEFYEVDIRSNIPKRKAAEKDIDDDYVLNKNSKHPDQVLKPAPARPKRSHNTTKKESIEKKLDDDSFENITKRRFLKTGYVYDTIMSYHATPDPIEIHPEDPQRLYRIYSILQKHGLLAECKRIKSRKATREEITDIHSITHYRKMRETTKFSKRTQYIDLEHIYDSVYLNSSSFESGLYAAGSLISLVEALVKDEIQNAFAIIRPPGHHAEHDVPMGFCLFNNVAIATKHCMKRLGVKKTLIVDWDVHFGNGTQSIFSNDPNVLYISLHRYEDKTFYPSDRKGSAEYTGHGEGKGTTVNIPWPCSGMTDADYIYAFKEIVIPIAMEFSPDLLIVSAGFDAAIDDPIGQCKVTPTGYAHMTHMLKSINNGKMAIALEGGYNLNSIAISALGCMNVLLGEAPPAIEHIFDPKKECIDTIKLVKKVQREYWRCCR